MIHVDKVSIEIFIELVVWAIYPYLLPRLPKLHLNSIGWATWAIRAAAEKIQP